MSGNPFSWWGFLILVTKMDISDQKKPVWVLLAKCWELLICYQSFSQAGKVPVKFMWTYYELSNIKGKVRLKYFSNKARLNHSSEKHIHLSLIQTTAYVNFQTFLKVCKVSIPFRNAKETSWNCDNIDIICSERDIWIYDAWRILFSPLKAKCLVISRCILFLISEANWINFLIRYEYSIFSHHTIPWVAVTVLTISDYVDFVF